MTLILGIDPGSRITGYGIISSTNAKYNYIASGCIRLKSTNLPERLQEIFSNLQTVIQHYEPAEAAIEQVFMHQNAGAAIKLGQARGAAIAAATASALSIAEYSARQIKQSVVGHGAAKKEQVQHMVKVLLNLSGVPQVDAADALAVALCHAQSRQSLNRINAINIKIPMRGRFRRGRMR